MTARIRSAVQIAILVAAVAAIAHTTAATRTPRFMVPIVSAAGGAPPKFSRELLPDTHTNFVHAPALAELPNGDLLASWYGGTDEIQPDVVIFASRLDRRTGTWSKPAIVETARAASDAIGSHVKSVGNPVLDAEPGGVSLYYTAVLMGGWSGGTICVKRSSDGVHWTDAQRVYASPFFNISMLVRGRPLRYTDGSVALPIYHQFLRRWSAVARIARDGTVVDEARIGGSSLLQPWVIPMSFTHAIALLRWSSRMPGNVNIAASDDAGLHWSAPWRTALMQRDTAVAGTRLSDGSLLAVYNNMTWDRRELSLARSPDEGEHWSHVLPVEQDHEGDLSIRHEYSYPYMFDTSDGMHHIVYTWRRVRIAHIAFNDAWAFSQSSLMSVRR